MKGAIKKEIVFRKNSKYILLAVIFGFIVTIHSYGGFGYSNQIEHLPPILRNLDGSFLLNDFFTNASTKGIARKFYIYIISKISGSEKNLPIVFFILTFLTNISISLATFFFTRYLFKNSSRSGILASSFVMSLSTFALAGDSSFLYITYLNQSFMAFAFILWAILFVAQSNLILGMIFSGIASLIHPLYGLEMGALLFFSYFISLLIQQRGIAKEQWKEIIPGFLIFTLFSLPSLIPQLSQQGIDSKLFIHIIAYFRNSHHYVPSTFSISQYVYTIVFVLTLAFIWYRERHKRDFLANQLVAILVGLILLLCIGGYFFVEIIPLRIMVIAQPFRLLQIVKWVGLVLIAGLLTNEALARETRMLYLISVFNPLTLGGSILTQTSRKWLEKKSGFLHNLLEPALVLFFVVVLIKLKPDEFSSTSIILLFLYILLMLVFEYLPQKLPSVLLILGIGLTMMIGFFHFQLPYIKDSYTLNQIYTLLVSNNLSLEIKSGLGADGDEVAKYVKENTSEKSIFLTPPNWGQFRLLAKRAIVVDFKAFLFTDTEMLEWYERITTCYGEATKTGLSMVPELVENYKVINDEALLQLKEKYSIDYAVLYLDTVTDFNVIFKNDTYKVVILPENSTGDK